MAGISHVLLDLSFLPSRGWVAELGLEDVVTGHCPEPSVHIALFTPPDAIDCRFRSTIVLGPMADKVSLS
jgi:hypothetical protein